MTTVVRNVGEDLSQRASNSAYERKVKPVDRLSTSRLEDLFPDESPLFELLGYERQIDSLILQKQMRIADAAFKGPKVKRMLKILVWNTAHGQDFQDNSSSHSASGPYAIFAVDNNEDLMAPEISESKSPLIPSWTLRIEGKLEAKAGRPSVSANRKFSSFIRSVVIEVCKNDSERDVLEWFQKPGQAEVDGFEVKRHGSTPVPIRILIDFDHQPERFKLSTQLSSLLGLQVSSKPHIILAMWRYVKLNKLQESDEKKVINCDKALRELFDGLSKCTFAELPTLIEPHLSRPDPVEIYYTVQMDKEISVSPFVFEVEVDVDDSMRLSRSLLTSPNLYNLQVDLDSATARQRELADALRATLSNYSILSEFSKDPVVTLERLFRQQCDDVHILTGETRVNFADLFNDQRFEDDDIDVAINEMMSSVSVIMIIR
jgi:SWI/SNF-related matrix-associated actin-dependent regulator of chromatin subfamily D